MDNILQEAADLMETRSRIEKAVEAACLVCNITRKEFYNKKRQRHLIDCRRMVFTFCRDVLKLTYQNIAKQFNVNHATCIHHRKVHTQLIESDKFYLQKYNGFQDLVKADIGFFDIQSIIEEVRVLKRKHLYHIISEKNLIANEKNSSKKE